MIPLTQEQIDNIFEPRREILTVEELKASCGRLLVDASGNVFCLNKTTLIDEYRGRYVGYECRIPNRTEPGYTIEWGQRKLKKGTWPVWITSEQTRSNASLPEIDLPCWEVLPGPTHQGEYIIAFYRLAFPDWDDIVKIEGWPRISERTWKYIWDKAAAFDGRYHPECVRGGAWALGSGFSSAHHDSDRANVPDWKIDLSPCKVAYKSTPFWFTIRRSDYGDANEYSTFYPNIVWEGGMQDSLETPDGVRRRDTLESAQLACEQRASQPLTWTSVPSEKWDGEWRSSIIQQEAQRAA